MSNVTYYLGGYLPDAPAQNRAEQWDLSTGYTAWDASGNVIAQRALNPDETAALTPDPLAGGYTVPGITPLLVLDLSDAARAQFTGLLVLLRESGAPDDMEWTIAGTDRVPRQFSVAQIRQMILGYGQYYAQLWAASLSNTTP